MSAALQRSLAKLRAEAEAMKNHPDLSQRLAGEFALEMLPPFLTVMTEAARRGSAAPESRTDTLVAITMASCMMCCNIVQNLVGLLGPSAGTSRDAAFAAVMKTLLPMLQSTHAGQSRHLDDLERTVFSNGEEVVFDFRNELRTKGEDHAQE